MYNPYMSMMGQGGFPGMNGMNGMGGAQYGHPMMGMMGQNPMMAAGGMATPGVQAGEGGLKPFDSTQMKRGRMGHYGYLEGRGELLLNTSTCQSLLTIWYQSSPGLQ